MTAGPSGLNIIDEYSRECLAIRVKRRLNSTDVIDMLTDLFIIRGIPAYIRSDKRPHSALGYRPPAPEAIIPIDRMPAMH